MIRLGLIIVILLVAGAMMVYVDRKFVDPWKHRRRQERLRRENEELDDLLGRR